MQNTFIKNNQFLTNNVNIVYYKCIKKQRGSRDNRATRDERKRKFKMELWCITTCTNLPQGM